jgi:hypothetical protein
LGRRNRSCGRPYRRVPTRGLPWQVNVDLERARFLITDSQCHNVLHLIAFSDRSRLVSSRIVSGTMGDNRERLKNSCPPMGRRCLIKEAFQSISSPPRRLSSTPCRCPTCTSQSFPPENSHITCIPEAAYAHPSASTAIIYPALSRGAFSKAMRHA